MNYYFASRWEHDTCLQFAMNTLSLHYCSDITAFHCHPQLCRCSTQFNERTTSKTHSKISWHSQQKISSKLYITDNVYVCAIDIILYCPSVWEEFWKDYWIANIAWWFSVFAQSHSLRLYITLVILHRMVIYGSKMESFELNKYLNSVRKRISNGWFNQNRIKKLYWKKV